VAAEHKILAPVQAAQAVVELVVEVAYQVREIQAVLDLIAVILYMQAVVVLVVQPQAEILLEVKAIHTALAVWEQHHKYQDQQ
jgi:hypothetical protein